MPQRYLMPQKEHKALKDELGLDPFMRIKKLMLIFYYINFDTSFGSVIGAGAKLQPIISLE